MHTDRQELALFPTGCLATGSMESYFQKIQEIPLLSLEEEQDLAKRYHQEGDPLAAKALVLAHLRYVARIAKNYAGYGLAVADLMQEGTVGLMKAVKRFDPTVGVRLVSFAVHWIKAEIHEFIIRNWRIVRVATTKAQRKLFFNLRSAKKRLGWFATEEIEAVARDLGVKPSEVREMEMRLNAHDESVFESSEEEDLPSKQVRALEAPFETEPLFALEATRSQAGQALHVVLAALDPRSRLIIEKRWLCEGAKATFKELSKILGISIERVRQLEQAAFKKLKEVLSSST